MVRWLLRGALLAGLSVSFFVACSAESNGGPPSVDCGQLKGSAPICGKVCANRCGCGECQPGTQSFIDGVLYVCSGKCFSLASSGTGGTSAGGGGAGGNTGGSAGVDCQGIDCNANPPVCGACATCACCNCSNGQLKTISGAQHICNAGCYQPVTGDGG